MTPFRRRTWPRYVAATAAYAMLCAFCLADAVPERKWFDIPQGEAEQTLKEFSRQANVQIVYLVDLVRAVQTRPVRGTHTASEALHTMFTNTGWRILQDETTGALAVSPGEGGKNSGVGGSGAGPDQSTHVSKANYNNEDTHPMSKPTLFARTVAFIAAATAPFIEAQVAPEPGAAKAEEPLALSPFEVTEDSTQGYFASSTMSGTRLNTKLEDIASSISVVTKQQMEDFAMLDLNDIFAYELGTEGTLNYTAFEVDRNGMVGDQIQDNPQGANRVRGISAANMSQSGFATSGRVPVDPINIDAVEISRGPNSNIFGLGEGSGTVNIVTASANLRRPSTNIQLRVDDLGGWRTSVDLNRPIINDKLAIRLSSVYQHDGFVREPAGFDTRRFNVMLRAQPFRSTTVRASFQSYRGEGTRATTMTPRDGVSDWIRLGSPTWDPLTSTVTVNGVQTYMGAVDPLGLTAQNVDDPIIFVDQGGIARWTISRMPATNATNGPNNVAGFNRLLETVPEPVRDGRPLFSTLAAVSSRDIYDYGSINLAAPNYIKDKTETSTVEFEQYFLDTEKHKIAFQFAWQRENSERYGRNVIGSSTPTGSSYYLYVDPNARLLDGTPNPFFLSPYIGAVEPVTRSNPYLRDTYRGQLAYILDLTSSKSKAWRLLGRHQFLGYYEERKTARENYRFRDAITSVHQPYALSGTPRADHTSINGYPIAPLAARAYYHYYVGDGSGYNVDYGSAMTEHGNYDFSWYNPLTSSWVTDDVTLGEAAFLSGSAGGAASLNLIKTRGAMMQNSFLGGRVITTFGWRTDENYNKRQAAAQLLANGYEFDYERIQEWVGDWDFRDGDTKTSGVVVKPFRGLGFIDEAQNKPGWSGVAAKIANGLSFHYNKSDSFRPETPAVSIYLESLENPTSEGKDFGFSLNFGNKLAFRANKYETTQILTRDGQAAVFVNRILQADLQAFSGSNRALPLQRQARAWVSQLNPGLSAEAVNTEVYRIMGITAEQDAAYRASIRAETNDIIARGEEYELSFNPSNYWTLKFNAARAEAIDANLSKNLTLWLDEREAIWENIIDPRTGEKWLDTHYSGELPSTNTALLSPRTYLQTMVYTPLAVAQAMEGKARSNMREWRFNLSTSYRMAGMTDQRFLKNLTVGGGVRWEDKASIGYYGIPVNGNYEESIYLDSDRPIYDSANAYFDAFLGYSTRLFGDRVRARFQLNVKNIQESGVSLRAVGAYPNGVPHTFRIIDPRTFVFTASFDL